MSRIRQWNEIKTQFKKGSLILGNGASIALSDVFKYSSLYESAVESEILTEKHQRIFSAFNTNDFETVLRRIWYTRRVNKSLDIDECVTDEAYNEIRAALVCTVHRHHASYDEISHALHSAQAFLRNFDDVLSLNFDLTLYWAIMEGRKADKRVGIKNAWLKDCFIAKEDFDSEELMTTDVGRWDDYSKPYGDQKGATRIFYPHGNLCLVTNMEGKTGKIIRSSYSYNDIRDTIAEHWKIGGLNPLFICEGSSEDKLRFILLNSYLREVYQKIIPNIKNSLTIYGWGMDKSDQHILDQLGKIENKNDFQIAVSVYQHDETKANAENNNNLDEIKLKLTKVGFHQENIQFFDAQSPGCWCHEDEQERDDEKSMWV